MDIAFLGGVCVVLLCAWAGSVIGAPKRRKTQGMILGALFPVLGVVIVYMLPTWDPDARGHPRFEQNQPVRGSAILDEFTKSGNEHKDRQ